MARKTDPLVPLAKKHRETCQTQAASLREQASKHRQQADNLDAQAAEIESHAAEWSDALEGR